MGADGLHFPQARAQSGYPEVTFSDELSDDSRTQVRELVSTDAPEWNAFVDRCESATFFHYVEWKDIIEQTLGHRCWYLIGERSGQIDGILPLAHVSSRLFGNVLISLPFLVYGGVVASDTGVADALVSRALDLARELNVDFLELRNLRSSSRNWVRKSTHVTFRKCIDPDPASNLMEIPRKQRAMVRKGIRAGLRAERDIDVSRLFPIMLECKRNLGTPFFNHQYLQAIVEGFGNKVEITTVASGADAVASVMSFRFRNEILPYYGGGRKEARLLCANDFMYWSVMEAACLSGVTLFDFGRSQIDSGSYQFKKHWGFDPQPLSYECVPVRKKEIVALSPDNSKYSAAINVWKKLPLPIARRLGPPLARLLY